jgi:hypothetical protein
VAKSFLPAGQYLAAIIRARDATELPIVLQRLEGVLILAAELHTKF